METRRRFSRLQQGEWFGLSSRIRQSRFSSYKDIEGMNPLQVPLWKFCTKDYKTPGSDVLHTAEKTFVLPFDKHRHNCIHRRIGLSTSYTECRLGQAGDFQVTLNWPICEPKGATQNMAKEVAQLLQSWLQPNRQLTQPANNAFLN